ncbi:hypothetical protein LCGC14_0757430 [marine sediment metagenome]|uniref:Uncharacterized protein n=1 Tax=marine sediment metagenome TaxID=412755 RepID=A0A0F9SMF1_9ZZZZ
MMRSYEAEKIALTGRLEEAIAEVQSLDRTLVQVYKERDEARYQLMDIRNSIPGGIVRDKLDVFIKAQHPSVSPANEEGG